MRVLFYFFTLMIGFKLYAYPDIIDKTRVFDYLTEHYPEVIRSISNNNYDELVKFSTSLLIGEDILKEFPSRTSFYMTNLVGAHWHESLYKDQRYNFSYADLSFAHMDHADLRKSEFFDARLWFAELTYASLSCKRIRGADFSYADLRHAKVTIDKDSYFISKTLLEGCGARYNKATKIISPMRRTSRSEKEWKMLFAYEKLIYKK